MPRTSAKRTSSRKPSRKSAAPKRRTRRTTAKRTSSRKPRKSAAPKRRTLTKRSCSYKPRKSAAPKRRVSAKTFVMSVQLLREADQADQTNVAHMVVANTEDFANDIIKWYKKRMSSRFFKAALSKFEISHVSGNRFKVTYATSRLNFLPLQIADPDDDGDYPINIDGSLYLVIGKL